MIGRAFVLVWPFDRAKVFPIPDTFAQPALNVAAGIAASPLSAGLAGTAPLLLWRRRAVRGRGPCNRAEASAYRARARSGETVTIGRAGRYQGVAKSRGGAGATR
ncbi:hypothetical protein Misp02_35920 [Microtetraspora sp. NBRC 16547]|nr:hypothetical protein Misp02_35920 [Microtetraspora sp. NBRC 16547]